MLKSYQNRAFLLLAMASLSSAAAPAARADDEESLWDALVRASVEAPLQTAATNAAPNAPVRHALGPIPGFTIPVAASSLVDESIFLHNKKLRHSSFGPVGDFIGRLQTATDTRVNLHGSSTFSYMARNVSGNPDAYTSDQYYGEGNNTFTNLSRLDVDATFFNSVHYKTSYNNDLLVNHSDPNYNRVQVDYNTKNTRLQWGDLNVGFQGNSLVDFSRYLHGVQFNQKWSNNFRTQMLYSQSKTETRTITITGNGSSGPYYVYAGQIVDGSAQVRINNRDLTAGKDYTLDLYNGELRFLNSLVILPSDTIAVSFETLGYGQTAGNVYGLRAEYAPTNGLHLGVTDIMQQSEGSSGPQIRTQEFYGYNTAGAAYILDYPIDLTKPLTVLVAGVPLVRGVDYVVDAGQTNQIRIAQAIPSTLVIKVQYIPISAAATPGNRSVMGFDGRVSLGKLGSVTTEAAFSGLSLQGSNIGGEAYQVHADLNLAPGLHTNITARNIGQSFSSVQSPGFNRNEKSLTFDADYSPNRRVRLSFNWLKAKRPSYNTSSSVTGSYSLTTNGNDTYDQYGGGITYNFVKNGSISLSRSALSTAFILGGKSTNTTDSLAIDYGFRTVTLNASLSNNSSFSDASNIFTGITTGTTAYNSNSTTFSKRLGLAWTPFHWFSFSGSTSENAIHTFSGTSDSHATARDTQLTARFSLFRRARLTYSYSLSDTGNISNTGTTASGGGNNYNLGGYGNYSGGYGNTGNYGYGVSSYGGRSAAHRLGLDIDPMRDMTLGIRLDHSSSVGDNLYNSTRDNYALTLGWRPSERWSFDAAYSVQKVAFTSSLGTSNGGSWSLGLNARPFGNRLTFALSLETSLTDSNISFANTTGSTGTVNPSTNLNSLFARIDYPIARRYSVFYQTRHSTSSGSLGSTDLDTQFGLRYSLTQNLNFSVGWQVVSRNNADPQYKAYDYNVSTFLTQLGFDFR